MDFTEVEESIAAENYSAARDLLLEHLKLVSSHRDEFAWLEVVDQLPAVYVAVLKEQLGLMHARQTRFDRPKFGQGAKRIRGEPDAGLLAELEPKPPPRSFTNAASPDLTQGKDFEPG